MLRNRQDIRSLVFIALTVAALLAPHTAAVQESLNTSWWLTLLWLGVASFLCFIASIINHNHMHCRMFSHDKLNLAVNLLLSFAKGHTATGIVVPHHLNHHPQAGSADDWISPRLAGRGLGWLRLLRFVIASSINMMKERRKPDAPQLPERRRKAQIIERIFLALAIACVLLHDWRAFLLFNVLPWLAGLALLVGVNLLQHEGCVPDAPFAESRNFTGRVSNWICFNNGFHTAHHWRPAAHWSELPALHSRLAGNLRHPDLEHKSILAFLWKFGWSGAPLPQLKI